jgi:uncharacterized protein
LQKHQFHHATDCLHRRYTMPISKELLDILICPQCRGNIYPNLKGNGLLCERCGLLCEVEDDIPNMLIEEAKKPD